MKRYTIIFTRNPKTFIIDTTSFVKVDRYLQRYLARGYSAIFLDRLQGVDYGTDYLSHYYYLAGLHGGTFTVYTAS